MLNVQTCSDKDQEVNDLALLLSCPALQDGPDDFFNILHIGSKSRHATHLQDFNQMLVIQPVKSLDICRARMHCANLCAPGNLCKPLCKMDASSANHGKFCKYRILPHNAVRFLMVSL